MYSGNNLKRMNGRGQESQLLVGGMDDWEAESLSYSIKQTEILNQHAGWAGAGNRRLKNKKNIAEKSDPEYKRFQSEVHDSFT